ncbi:MAG: DUF1302 family protein [Candidatus Aminicenantes bacterium]
MKHAIILCLLVSLLMMPAFTADVDITGRVKLFSSVFLTKNLEGKFFSHESGEFALKRLEARLGFSGSLADNISFSVRFDSFTSPDAWLAPDSFPESSSLGAPAGTEPFDIFLYEGHILFRRFLVPGLKLTVGKQRIQWGTTGKMSVVDNLNPVDFANFLTFDPDYFMERRPQTAMNLEYQLSSRARLQLIWLLSRQHSPLPAGFTRMMASPSTVIYRDHVHIEQEKPLLKHTNLGFRYSTVLLQAEWGLSYYHGNYHLPVLKGLTTLPWRRDQFYQYPQKDIFGLDVSGKFFSIGFRAEGAYIRPEKMDGFMAQAHVIDGIYLVEKTVFSLFEKDYFQYVLSVDHTLGIADGLYINAQYIHGFFDERDYSEKAERHLKFQSGMFFGEIQDYIFGQAKLNLLGKNLKIELKGIIEFADSRTPVVWMPSIRYKAFDDAALQAGLFLVSGGDENTKFGIFKDDKLAYFAFTLDF